MFRTPGMDVDHSMDSSETLRMPGFLRAFRASLTLLALQAVHSKRAAIRETLDESRDLARCLRNIGKRQSASS